MALGKLSIVLLMVANACSVLSQTDPTCITPVRLEGFCVPIERCRNIYNTVRTSKTLSRNVQNYINRLECTLPDVVRSICCVPQEVDPKMPSTTPVITTTSFKTRISTTIPTTTPEITTTSTTTPASTTTPVITTTSTTTAASTTPPVITTTPASTTTPAITTTSSTIPVIATIPTTTPVIMTTTTHEELNELPNGQNWSLLPTTACGQILGERIAHGNATEPFEYPWMVLLLYLWNGVLTDGCGGSLINKRYVLTAAHCVRTSSVFKLSKVRLGEHDKTKEIDCIVYEDDYKDCADRPIEIDIESTVVHSEYNRPIRFRHDIALIRMVQDVEFSDSIIPLCLPIREDIRNMMLPKYTVTGWGITEEKTASDILQQADLNHVPVSDCQQKMKENGLRIDLSEEYQMCAGGEGLVDSCKGDSGGPLGSFVDLIGGKYVQYGIVSAGAGTCGISRVPGIYTRVSSYMDWIVENMQP